MYTIGEFAGIGRVSVRMLRHYDAIGLLRPVHVDDRTGYRRYAPAQVPHLLRLGRTLAGCVLTLHKDRLQVTREPSAVRHSCEAGRGPLLWDGRFELQFKGPEAALAGIAVACLGRAGLAEARAQ